MLASRNQKSLVLLLAEAKQIEIKHIERKVPKVICSQNLFRQIANSLAVGSLPFAREKQEIRRMPSSFYSLETSLYTFDLYYT
jgi:hypothetical protein